MRATRCWKAASFTIEASNVFLDADYADQRADVNPRPVCADFRYGQRLWV